MELKVHGAAKKQHQCADAMHGCSRHINWGNLVWFGNQEHSVRLILKPFSAYMGRCMGYFSVDSGSMQN